MREEDAAICQPISRAHLEVEADAAAASAGMRSHGRHCVRSTTGKPRVPAAPRRATTTAAQGVIERASSSAIVLLLHTAHSALRAVLEVQDFLLLLCTSGAQQRGVTSRHACFERLIQNVLRRSQKQGRLSGAV